MNQTKARVQTKWIDKFMDSAIGIVEIWNVLGRICILCERKSDDGEKLIAYFIRFACNRQRRWRQKILKHSFLYCICTTESKCIFLSNYSFQTVKKNCNCASHAIHWSWLWYGRSCSFRGIPMHLDKWCLWSCDCMRALTRAYYIFHSHSYT